MSADSIQTAPLDTDGYVIVREAEPRFYRGPDIWVSSRSEAAQWATRELASVWAEHFSRSNGPCSVV